MHVLAYRTTKAYHWWLAIGIAIAAHAYLLINYSFTPPTENELAEEQPGIVIKLSHMSMPQPVPKAKVEPLPVKFPDLPKPVEPTPKKPTPIKKKVVKKKVAPPEPEVKQVVQKVVEPQVEPIPKVETNTQPTVIREKTSVTTQVQPNNVIGEEVALANAKASYLVRLSAWLAKHKRYPSVARRRKQEGIVKVEFWIDARGQLISYDLVKPSPFSSLNKAVEDMLKRASPMPAVPPELRKGKTKYKYTIPVEFNLRN